MKKLIFVFVLALFVLPLTFVGPAYASSCNTAQSVFGDSYTLGKGQTLNSNLVVFGGNVTIEAGATVNCSVVVFGGNVEIAGAIDEDVTVIGGNVDLHSTAVVSGKLSTVGGSISRDEGATVQGGESQGFDQTWGSPRIYLPASLRIFDPVFLLIQSVFSIVFSAIAMGLLALLVVLFWPDQTARVSAAITTAPAASGGLGLLTLIAVPVLIVVTAITLCLLPFSFVGALIFAAAIIFGWMALGMLVGARLTAALKWHTLSPAVSAGIGTLLFTLVANIIGSVPCVGWVVPLMLAAIGLGAVTLTRFGTQPYLPNLPMRPTPPPAPDAGGAAMAS
jgi:hypothetical protein